MDTVQIVYIIAICLLYTFFFHKLSHFIYKSDKSDCGNLVNKLPLKNTTNDPEDTNYTLYSKCMVSSDNNKKKRQSNIFRMLIVIGIASLIGSSYIPSDIASKGISIGSLLLIIDAIIMYWINFDDKDKLILTGVSLGCILYASNKLYSGESIMDVLPNLFGKRHQL